MRLPAMMRFMIEEMRKDRTPPLRPGVTLYFIPQILFKGSLLETIDEGDDPRVLGKTRRGERRQVVI
jgi:hypothetical protein